MRQTAVRLKRLYVAASLAVAAAVPAQAGVGPVPQWIWASALPRDGEQAVFESTFAVREKVKRAVLDGLADDRMRVLLNGEEVAAVAGHTEWTTTEVTAKLRPGANTIRLAAENVHGDAGVCVRLRIEYADGRRATIVTDPTWRAQAGTSFATNDPPERRPYAVSRGLVGVPPWGDPAGEEGDYYQWQRALGATSAGDAAEIQVIPGFQVELVRSARPGDSSWISLVADPDGRLIIGCEGRDKRHGLLRMTLPSRPGDEPRLESLEETLLEPRGLAFLGRDLFVNANNAFTLFRLRDEDGDGRFEQLTPLRKTGGSVGHGRNNLAAGPDGRIYSIHGNDVRLPDDFESTQSRCRHVADDQLNVCRWNRFLFDGQTRLPGGHLIRTDRDGKSWEMIACGFRNPYGIDFNADGECFTFDADNEGDLGAPWYRPTRVNQIVSGGDYGWRQGTAMRPSFYPDSVPANLEIGKSSPTDIKFGARSNFPPRYRQALFLLDWTYGRIYALQVLPRGASYVMTAENFLEGRPLNVTDLEFGKDGALYFTTGGRGTQSGLYRVRFVGPAGVVDPPVLALKEEFAAASEARAVRKRAESFHASTNRMTVSTVWRHLDSPDLWIRHAARIAIERQPVKTWQDQALIEERKTSSVTALMALARSADRETLPAVIDRLNSLPLADASPERQVIALRAYQVALLRHGKLEADRASRTRERLESLFPATSLPANQFACELLVHLESPQVVPKTLGLLRQATLQKEKLLWLYELRSVRQGWTLDDRRYYLGQLAKADAFDGGRDMPVVLFSIGSEFRATLTADEAQALAPLLVATSGPGTNAPLVPLRPVLREWALADLTDSLAATDAKRNLERGREVYREANCIVCHRFAGVGRPIGPDLKAVGRRLSRRDLLETILVPSKVIDAKFRDQSFELESGRVVVGRVVGGDDVTFLVSSNPASPFQTAQVRRAEIVSQTESKISPMPAGLLNSFTADDILDLLAWLDSDGRLANGEHRRNERAQP